MTASPRVRILFDEETIAARNEDIARAVAGANPENLLVVAVLKGSFMFAADLIRALHRAGLSPQVEDIPTSAYPTPARRPANSRLNCAAIERDFGIARPDWRAGLDRVIQELSA